MTRLVAVFLMALAVPLLSASPASALSCKAFLPEAVDSEWISTLFVGRLVSIGGAEEPGTLQETAPLTYEVERTFKGDQLPKRADIVYQYGFVGDLTLGERYYVGMDDANRASICTTSHFGETADLWAAYERDFIAAGGDGRPPTADTEPNHEGTHDDEGSPWPWVIAGGGITLLALLGAAAAARRGNY